MGVGVLDKSIVVVGGWTGHTTLTRVDAYNVETRTWIQLRSLPAPRELVLGATAINGKLYVAGGRSADAMNREEKTLFVYDPGTNTWSRGSNRRTTTGRPSKDSKMPSKSHICRFSS